MTFAEMWEETYRDKTPEEIQEMHERARRAIRRQYWNLACAFNRYRLPPGVYR